MLLLFTELWRWNSDVERCVLTGCDGSRGCGVAWFVQRSMTWMHLGHLLMLYLF